MRGGSEPSWSGVDFSRVAIKQARAPAKRLGLSQRVEFRLADAAATGLDDGCAAGLVCIDGIQFSQGREVMAEVARLLEPAGLAVVTTWESAERRPLAALFEGAGLDVVAVEERPAWAARQRAIYEQALAEESRYPEDRGLQRLA